MLPLTHKRLRHRSTFLTHIFFFFESDAKIENKQKNSSFFSIHFFQLFANEAKTKFFFVSNVRQTFQDYKKLRTKTVFSRA